MKENCVNFNFPDVRTSASAGEAKYFLIRSTVGKIVLNQAKTDLVYFIFGKLKDFNCQSFAEDHILNEV